MRLLRRYIMAAVMQSTLTVLSVVMLVNLCMKLMAEFPRVGRGSYDVYHAILFVLMGLPSDLYQLFPMIGFLGSIVGLGRLASSSELLVIRAAGVSRGRIVRAVALAAVVMLMGVVVLGEWVGPSLSQRAVSMRQHAMGGGDRLLDGVWLVRNNQYVQIGDVVSPQQIRDISQFRFDDTGRLQSLSHAERGRYHDHHWILRDVWQQQLTGQRVTSRHLEKMNLNIDFVPQKRADKRRWSVSQSIGQLMNNIRYLTRVGLTANQFQFAFWQRLVTPITIMVMICLGVPFVFGSLRESTAGARMLTGVLVGFVFYMLNQLFGPISLVFQFPPVLAAVMPTLLFIVIYFILNRSRT